MKFSHILGLCLGAVFFSFSFRASAAAASSSDYSLDLVLDVLEADESCFLQASEGSEKESAVKMIAAEDGPAVTCKGRWTIKCMSAADMDAVAQCDGANCTIRFSEQYCKDNGYKTGDPINPEERLKKIPTLKPTTLKQAVDYCIEFHELTHANQKTKKRSCDDEQDAFTAQGKCLEDYYNAVCGTNQGQPGGFSEKDCSNLWVQVCTSKRGGTDLNKCVCAEKDKPVPPGERRVLDCDKCKKTCTDSITDCIKQKVNLDDPRLPANIKDLMKRANEVYCHNSAVKYCK